MKVKVYILKYRIEAKTLVFSESLDRDTAFALAKRYAKLGRSPVVIRVDADHRQIISCGTSSQKRIA